jgi:cytochrome c oxidase assembly protein subunit 15
MIFILKAKSAQKSTKIFSIISACAVFGQIFLGGVVITEKLHSLLVTAHLGLGLILYSSLIYVVINTFYTNSKIKPFSSTSLTSSPSSDLGEKRKSSSKFFSNFVF